MYAARITFRHHGGGASNAISRLLASWYKNGQIAAPHWPLTAAARRTVVHVSIPAEDALASEHANLYVRQDLRALRKAAVDAPIVKILGADPESASPCACRRRHGLILCTDFLSDESPVRCASCFGPVPLYRLPPTHDHEHFDILRWAADYRACDTLQVNCSVGERFGERQLARHDSELSILGRGLCRAMEKKSARRVYYHLHASRGRGLASERRRRCPACGGAWALPAPWHGRFDFRCDACALLSNIATEFGG